MNFDNTYVNIDLDAIWDNFQAIREKAGVAVMAVVKADAYGHGAVPVSRLLEPVCAFFGVATVSEALELRKAGISKPILILGYTPPQAFETLVREQIRPSIFCWEDAQALSLQAQQLGLTAPFHFALDSGMGRIGFQPTWEDAQVCAKIAALPGLHPEGLFSHFATADGADLSAARQQAKRFGEFDSYLRQLGVQVVLRHLDNSAGIMNFDCHYEMVRSGIITYGLYPSPAVNPELLNLRPAMSWHSHICHIKWLAPGTPIGYGGSFVTAKDTRVATVTAGYADGYRRILSNRFYVLIHGCKAPILGRICMDQMMVDVTDIPQAAVGDTVVLMGRDGDAMISAEALAEAAGSFNYEQVSTVGRRCSRHYYRQGCLVARKNYLE